MRSRPLISLLQGFCISFMPLFQLIIVRAEHRKSMLMNVLISDTHCEQLRVAIRFFESPILIGIVKNIQSSVLIRQMTIEVCSHSLNDINIRINVKCCSWERKSSWQKVEIAISNTTKIREIEMSWTKKNAPPSHRLTLTFHLNNLIHTCTNKKPYC